MPASICQTSVGLCRCFGFVRMHSAMFGYAAPARKNGGFYAQSHYYRKTVRKPRTRDRTGGCGIDGIEFLRQQSDNDVSSENGHKLRQACRCRRKDPEQRALYACNGIVDFCKYDIAFNTADKRQTVFRSVGSYKIACRTGTVGVRRAVRRLGS